jgi:hypothetical protein
MCISSTQVYNTYCELVLCRLSKIHYQGHNPSQSSILRYHLVKFFLYFQKKNNLFIVFRRNSERKRRTHEFIKKFLKFDLVVTHINLQLLIRSRSIQYLIYFIKL